MEVPNTLVQCPPSSRKLKALIVIEKSRGPPNENLFAGTPKAVEAPNRQLDMHRFSVVAMAGSVRSS